MDITPHIDQEVHGNVLEVHLHGKLSHEDYERSVPEIDRLIARYGKIRVLTVMHNFHGWDAGAALDSIQWNAHHIRQIERLAVAGDETIQSSSGVFDLSLTRKLHWQKWLTNFRRLFTSAQVRYFTLDQLEAARTWINES
ncbi:MAG TPA: STAS/SEC14 domain-containing protein [Chthoniobacter sp.]|jgi:hypothetical protein